MEKMIVSSEIIRIFSSANYYYGKTVALLGLKSENHPVFRFNAVILTLILRESTL